MQNFKSLSFTDRLSRIGYLLRNTFTVVGRDPDIAKPLIWMSVYATVMVTAFFVGVTAIFLEAGLVAAVGLGFAVLPYLYKFFFYNYKEMDQSWLVYETICGRDRSYSDAKQKARDRIVEDLQPQLVSYLRMESESVTMPEASQEAVPSR